MIEYFSDGTGYKIMAKTIDGGVRLYRTSPFSKTENFMELPVKISDLYNYYVKRAGMIQDIFPALNSEQREFIMTGIMPDEWPDNSDEYPDGSEREDSQWH